MRKLFTILILLINVSYIYSQNEDENVLSYYAVGNSLDGQPLIGKTNKLRFYPVFVFRESTKDVIVTVYHGPGVYTRKADKYDEGRYWETLLPPFSFGEAIQRLEVETKIDISETYYQEKIQKLKELKKNLKENYENIEKEFKITSDEFRKVSIEKLNELTKQINILLNKIISYIKDDLEEKQLEDFKKEYELAKGKIDTLKRKVSNLDSEKQREDDVNNIYLDLEDLQTQINVLYGYSSSMEEIKTQVENIKKRIKDLSTYMKDSFPGEMEVKINEIFGKNVEQSIIRLQAYEDSVKNSIVRDMKADFNDNSLVGPSINKSDIIFSKDYSHVRILYRNYKTTLRQMPALDPAEQLGIFRIRYIPFPVVGKTLFRPFQENSVAVFEVGLGFGNVAVPGDEFVKPTLSFDRLGVAFAITEKLFGDSAQIMALALTYDFNVYGSLGVGVNFANVNNGKAYYSIGLNKTAFELLITQLAKFFGIK